MTLILWPSHASGATASETEMFRFAASGSKSHTVVPSSTRPARGIVPAVNSRASASVVLPDPPWPTSTTLRIFAVGNVSPCDLPGCFVLLGAGRFLSWSPDATHARMTDARGVGWYLDQAEHVPGGSAAPHARRPSARHRVAWSHAHRSRTRARRCRTRRVDGARPRAVGGHRAARRVRPPDLGCRRAHREWHRRPARRLGRAHLRP